MFKWPGTGVTVTLWTTSVNTLPSQGAVKRKADESMSRRSDIIIEKLKENNSEQEELASWNLHEFSELFQIAKNLINFWTWISYETKPQNDI